ncbi:SRPBCC family protein [Jiangella aurantiaca]|nr:SRPBCC family protein [Jiangella aurantiaca]
MRFTNVISINRSLDQVFDYLIHFENIPRWNYAITETRMITDGPVCVGSRYVQTRTIPSPSTESFEITAFEPRSGFSLSGDLGPFAAHVSYALQPTADATVLTNTMDLRAAGPRRLVARLAAPGIESAVAANLGVLKNLLENGDADTLGRRH